MHAPRARTLTPHLVRAHQLRHPVLQAIVNQCHGSLIPLLGEYVEVGRARGIARLVHGGGRV